MKTINFRQFAIFTDITRKNTATVDASRDVSEALYKGANGIMAHSLAIRIYESQGTIELSAEEEAFLRRFIQEATTPVFQDSFEANLKSE